MVKQVLKQNGSNWLSVCQADHDHDRDPDLFSPVDRPLYTKGNEYKHYGSFTTTALINSRVCDSFQEERHE